MMNKMYGAGHGTESRTAAMPGRTLGDAPDRLARQIEARLVDAVDAVVIS